MMVTIVTVEAFLFWPDTLFWPLLSAAAAGGRPSGGRCGAGKGEGGRADVGPQPSALCRLHLPEGGKMLSKRAEERREEDYVQCTGEGGGRGVGRGRENASLSVRSRCAEVG